MVDLKKGDIIRFKDKGTDDEILAVVKGTREYPPNPLFDKDGGKAVLMESLAILHRPGVPRRVLSRNLKYLEEGEVEILEKKDLPLFINWNTSPLFNKLIQEV